MSFPALTAFIRNFESTPAADHEEQALNLDRVRELALYVESKGAMEIQRCLVAAGNLVSLMVNESPRVEFAEVKRLVTETLKFAEDMAKPNSERANGAKTPAPMPGTGSGARAGDDSGLLDSSTELGEGEALPSNDGMVLGRLLLELGYATRDQVAQALQAHRKIGLPIGECFLMHGTVSPDHILDALRTQERMRSGTDSEASRQRVEMQRVADEQCQDDAKEKVALKPEPATAGMRLTAETLIGEILLGLGMITNEQLQQGMQLHDSEGKRIGEALVEVGALSEAELEQGLDMQRRLRHVAGL